MFPRVPDQYESSSNLQSTEARDRDITLRWLEGVGIDQVARRYDLTADQVEEILKAAPQKQLREEVRQRAVDYTLERFDATAPKNLEVLVQLRDHSDDEKMQRMAALDLLEYSSLKKKSGEDGNIGADLIRGIAKLAKEQMEAKPSEEANRKVS